MDDLVIYVISDSVGETAQQVTQAALSQFNKEYDCEIRRFPYVADDKCLIEILENGKTEQALIVYTLVSENLLNITNEFCDKENLSYIDLMTPLLYAGLFYLLFIGILTLAFGFAEKKLSYYKV